MADEQDKWLDRETAELLLRGEPPEGVDPASRDRAGRLALALGALSAPQAPADEELPGEAAALAAFRKVRAERADASAQASAALGHGAAPRPSDTGLVRIGARGEGARRPRRSRPLRLGLAAALTVGMIGGVAAAAGTGVLPTPFDGTEPEPAATVSAAVSPGRPSAPPSPLEGVRDGASPSAPPGAPGGGGTERDGGAARDRDADDRDTGGLDGRRSNLAASCRKVRTGQELGPSQRRALKEAAGSVARIAKYCGSLLAPADGGGRKGGDHGGGSAAPTHEGELRADTGDGDGQGGKSGKGEKEDKGDKGNNGNKNGNGGKGNGGKKSNHADQGDEGDDGGNGSGDDAASPAHVPHHPAAPRRSQEPRPHRQPAYTPHASSPADAS
ncbi:hypothetical protein [Streptomyces violaceorubidus]